MNYRSKIIGLGHHLPSKVITNHDLEKMMDTSDEWITKRTGIKERRWVDENTSTSDLALEASLKALEDAGVNKDDLDMILFATVSPDHEFPGTACFLQAKLGLSKIPAIDIRQQCTGFIYGLSIADLYIRSGQYKNILLVGAEVHSKGLDKTTRGRDVTVLFGDGAGAAVLTRASEGDESQIFSTHLYADGNFADELWVQAPGSACGAERLDNTMLEECKHFPYMNGKKVFTHAIRRICESIVESAEKNGYKMEDIDLFILHQANQRILDMVAKQLKLNPEKVFNTIEKLGNTTAGTIPIGLSMAKDAGKLKKGTLVCSSAFGSGFTWGSALYRY